MQVTTSSTEETKKLAYKTAAKLKAGSVVILSGDLGSGKTTFTGYLVEALGIKARVQSPTFVLVRKYGSKIKNAISVAYHADLYRITSREDLLDLDLTGLLSEEKAILIIEWPELFVKEYEGKIPMYKIFIEILGETKRRFNVQDIY